MKYVGWSDSLDLLGVLDLILELMLALAVVCRFINQYELALLALMSEKCEVTRELPLAYLAGWDERSHTGVVVNQWRTLYEKIPAQS